MNKLLVSMLIVVPLVLIDVILPRSLYKKPVPMRKPSRSMRKVSSSSSIARESTTLEIFQKAGHSPHEDFPERFNRLAIAFLSE